MGEVVFIFWVKLSSCLGEVVFSSPEEEEFQQNYIVALFKFSDPMTLDCSKLVPVNMTVFRILPVRPQSHNLKGLLTKSVPGGVAGRI